MSLNQCCVPLCKHSFSDSLYWLCIALPQVALRSFWLRTRSLWWFDSICNVTYYVYYFYCIANNKSNIQVFLQCMVCDPTERTKRPKRVWACDWRSHVPALLTFSLYPAPGTWHCHATILHLVDQPYLRFFAILMKHKFSSSSKLIFGCFFCAMCMQCSIGYRHCCKWLYVPWSGHFPTI